MEMSPEIGELGKSLAKAQETLAKASKDASNDYLNSSYATLASVWDAWQAVGPANGLGVIQTVDGSGGEYEVTTMLTHASGQWIKSVTPILIVKKDMQGLGSAITYARRYGLSAMVGISPEDDDGNTASKSPQTKSAPAKQQKPTPAQDAQALAVQMHKELDVCKTVDELDTCWNQDGMDVNLAYIGDQSQKGMDGVLAKYEACRKKLETPAL